MAGRQDKGTRLAHENTHRRKEMIERVKQGLCKDLDLLHNIQEMAKVIKQLVDDKVEEQ